MSNSIRPSESSIESKLDYLYARRAIVDDLIKSLELYCAATSEPMAKKGAKRQGSAGNAVWSQALAS